MKRTNPTQHETETTQISEHQALQIFSGQSFLIINKTALKMYGINYCMFLSNLIDKYRYFKYENKLSDGWFFLTHEKQEADTSLPLYQIREAKKFFKDRGIIETRMHGMPAKEQYKLYWKALVADLDSYLITDFNGRDINQKSVDKNHSNSNGKANGQKSESNKSEQNQSLEQTEAIRLIKSQACKISTARPVESDMPRPVGNSTAMYIYNNTKYNNTKGLVSKETSTLLKWEDILDKIHNIVSYWAELPNTTAHQINDKNPSKVYSFIIKKLTNLLIGLPIDEKSDGTPTKSLLKFAKANGLPKKLIWRCWTEDEIKQVLHDMVTDTTNEKSHSLGDSIWSSFAWRGKSGSWFLLRVADTNVPKKYKYLAHLLSKAVPTGSMAQKYEWAREFQKFIYKQDVISEKELKDLLAWYSKNHKNKYVRSVRDADEFLEYYQKIAKSKSIQEDKGEDNSPSTGYLEKEYKYKKDELKL